MQLQPPSDIQNLYPTLTPQKSLLSQALSYLPFPFPVPYQNLQQNLSYVPQYLRNETLYKQIHSENKRKILGKFQEICADVTLSYCALEEKYKNQGFTVDQYLKALSQKNSSSSLNGQNSAQYLSNLQKQFSGSRNYSINPQNNVDFLRIVMKNLGMTHIKIFGYPQNSGNLPQKYQTAIEQKINYIIKPIDNNYFQNLIINSLNGLPNNNPPQQGYLVPQQQNQDRGNRKTYDEVNADNMAQYMRSKIAQKYTQKPQIKPTDSTLNFLPYALVPPPFSTQNNVISELLRHIQTQQLNNSHQQQPVQNIDLQNWFNNTFSQMTYYQSYMMAHMAQLIFINWSKFNPKLIKYHPFLEQLIEVVEQEMQGVKNQEIGFGFVWQSRLAMGLTQGKGRIRNLPIQCMKNMKGENGNLNVEKQAAKEKSQQKGILNKVKNVIKACSSKKQQKQPVKMFSPNENIKNLQDILTPNSNQIFLFYYKPTISDMSQLHYYLQSLNPQKNTTNFLQKAAYKIANISEQIKNKIQHDESGKQYFQIQSYMALVMILYKGLALNVNNNCEYTPFRRREIIKTCKRIFINEKKKKNKKADESETPFKNWPIVLKFLQNNRPEIESAPLSSTIQKQMQQIIDQIYKNMHKNNNSTNDIFHGLEVDYQNIPAIKIVCLSRGFSSQQNIKKTKTATQCKVVHILISGFLSEDSDKLQQWADMVDHMADSQVYALVYQSNTIKNLVKFMFKSAADIISAAKMIDELHRKYTDNPFNPAFKVAQITGRILAEVVIKLFPNRFVNVCGYSLGSQVIKQYLRRMVEQNKAHLINNIYIMGGVSDAPLFQQIIAESSAPISFYNCYTKSDAVLKRLLSLCKPNVVPMGLNQLKKIQGHSVINVDCTKFISGHLAFRSNLSLMGEVLEMSVG